MISAHASGAVPVFSKNRPPRVDVRRGLRSKADESPMPRQVVEPFPVGDLPVARPSSAAGSSYRRTDTRVMSVADWDAIPRNPRQRNEMVRIEKKRIDHLLNPTEKHREVAMGILPDGRQYKADGHTRCAAWRMGLVPAPDYLIVDVYACNDEAAIEDLYDSFDNSAAVESGTDRVTGAYSEAGIQPNSAFLREGGISTAARSLYHFLMRTAPDKKTKNDAINRCVRMFADEIMLLDAVPPTRILFPTGIIMGALLTFAENPESATRFWTAYAADSGWKEGGRVDAVQGLRERHTRLRGKSNGVRDMALMNYSISAFRGFQSGSTYTGQHLFREISKDVLRKYADEILESKAGK